MTITRVYIDGFNLYYGIVAENRLHWLDLARFAVLLNRGDPVDRVIYCTAMVSSRPSDPLKAQRQDTYHRTLAAHCPSVEILEGNFSTHRKASPVAGCPNDPSCVVRVSVRNEKGSDVNLAARLLHDGHMGRFDRAIVVSGDSDLVEPVRLVAVELGKTVWVRNPRAVESKELSAVATDYARIRPAVLQASQLPPVVVTAGGKQYHKPPEWSQPRPATQKTTVLTAPCPQAGCGKLIQTHRHL